MAAVRTTNTSIENYEVVRECTVSVLANAVITIDSNMFILVINVELVVLLLTLIFMF